MNLASFAHRVATDAAFTAHVQDALQSALATADLSLDDDSYAAILSILHSNTRLEELCSPQFINHYTLEWS